jgi:hypothetical protein
VTSFASYAIPGLIYFVNNNCLFYILQVRVAGREGGRVTSSRAERGLGG